MARALHYPPIAMNGPRHRSLPVLLLLLFTLLGAQLAPASRGEAAPHRGEAAPQEQGTAQAPEASFEDEVAVGYVLVPVVVRNASGGYARNLEENDFRLLVDGRQVAIDSFEQRAEAPASVVVLQDLSGSMATAGKLETSQRIANYFLDHALTGDEFAIATFAGEQATIDVPFTPDLSVLKSAVARWEGYGKTALHDAVAGIPRISLTGRNPKRFAILVTDGVDNASRMDPAAARDVVREAQLPVYVIGMESGSPFEVSSETGKKVYRYADVLNLLAHQTGGRYFSLNRPEDLETALAAISEDLRHQYVLGFPTGQGRSSFRDLRVEVAGAKNRSILFRKGYKGPPPAALVRGG